LSLPSRLFDVEQFRGESARLAVARTVTQPTLVLGSTQPMELVAPEPVRQGAVAVVRRRGGGGSVFLRPADHLWIDAWIPRDDPLWEDDVSAAAAWAGAWWIAALAEMGLRDLEIHAGRAVPGQFGHLVCFAGRGPGEVLHHGRKVMGLSQWRSREGALFSTCAYGRWDPAPLIDVVEMEPGDRAGLVDALVPLVVGVDDLAPSPVDLGALRDALMASFPAWAAAG
jgi:lipoate-protein ligase A